MYPAVIMASEGEVFKLQFIGLRPDKPQMMCAAGAMKFALAK